MRITLIKVDDEKWKLSSPAKDEYLLFEPNWVKIMTEKAKV
jgi:hypothetical protein